MEIKDGGILIISSPRSGSTNLMKSIASAYNKKACFEPDIISKFPNYNPKDDVVKYIPLKQNHSSVRKIYDSEYHTMIKHINEFNTVIILDRLDKKQQLESFYVLREYNNTLVNIKWRDEKIDYTSEKYNIYEQYINWFSDILLRISKDLNIPIDYYENVYQNKSLSNKNIKLDLNYFDSKYKLRQKIEPKRLV